MKTLFACLITIGMIATCHAQTTLPLEILAKPTHIGDQEQKEMKNAKPDAPALESKFAWAGRSPFGEVFLVIKVSHLVPKDYAEFQRGFWQTSISLNGQDLGILNKLLRGKEETPKVETLVIPIKGTLLREGENVLLIRPGAKDADLDDFELHSVSLVNQRPR
jgi:hypothetical protein